MRLLAAAGLLVLPQVMTAEVGAGKLGSWVLKFWVGGS
jgi:hypothetical protein